MTLLVLLSSPRAYITLQSEIDAAVRSGAILPAPSVVTEAQARSLPYLQAVIFEALRLYPPASGLKHKQVPEAGVVEHGYCLPAGTQVAQNIAGITRNPELFAPDPKVFRPERWVDARADEEDAQQYRAMREAVDLVFGYGKYQCMGKGTALMELNKVIVEVSLVSGEEPW
jgi:cytochrome P450